MGIFTQSGANRPNQSGFGLNLNMFGDSAGSFAFVLRNKKAQE
jgi:hypothetical protein